MKYVDELNLEGRKVFVRADLNVPLQDEHVVQEDTRLARLIPTLKHILSSKAALTVVGGHLGRPNGRPGSSKLSMKPVAARLSELLEREVIMAPDACGPEVEALAARSAPGTVIMLENLLTHRGEEESSPEFAALLSRLGDVYVNDAYSACHRRYASIAALPYRFKSKAGGLLLKKELESFERAFINPRPPLCILLGGAKVSAKMNVLGSVAQKADKILIGGGLANSFLAAQGLQMGRSLYEQELYPKVLALVGMLARRDCKLYLPIDFTVGPSSSAAGLGRPVPALEMPADMQALDIGPATTLLFKEALQSAETIIWSGAMGVFENSDYSAGTFGMVEHIASAHAFKVACGGDTTTAIRAMELEHKFDHVYHGGGAFLTMLEGKKLPGLAALEK